MTASADILILGAGWTAEFLIPLLRLDAQTYSSSAPYASPSLSSTISNISLEEPLHHPISFCATTRDGRVVADYKTLTFTVDADSDWSLVPKAKTIVLTFPTTEEGLVTKFVQGYEKVHGEGARWIQLGSTGAWNEASILLVSFLQSYPYSKTLHHDLIAFLTGRQQRNFMLIPRTHPNLSS